MVVIREQIMLLSINCRRLATAILVAFPLIASSSLAMADTVTLGGVGGLTPLIKRLAEDYRKDHPGTTILVVHPPLGSTGGLRALAAGKVDFSLVGRELKSDEAFKAQAWLQTPLVLATNGGKSSGLSLSQIAELYSARKTTWDDGTPVSLILRRPQESETADLRSMSPAIDSAVSEALKRKDTVMADSDLDALDLLVRTKGSLGTATLGLIKTEGARLALLPIDGKTPDLKSLDAGTYHWRRKYQLVTSHAAPPQGAAAAFLGYLGTERALKLARELGYLPVTSAKQ